VLVFRDVEHAGAEVLGLDCGLSGQQLEDLPDNRIVNSFERFHDSTRRSDIDLVSEAFRSLLESFLCGGSVRCLQTGEVVTYESTLEGSVVATQKRLFGEVHSNLFSNGDICEEHELGSDSSQSGLYIKSRRIHHTS
jgi:hypothetical protein